MKALPVMMIFVDGLGLGTRDPAVNPVHSGVCPVLEALLDGAIPLDATLGVPGLPQSATGQTALLTGINAAERVGRHVEGFPGPALREIIREHNVFLQLARHGCRSTFANAYAVDEVKEVMQRAIQSVTTVAALSAFGTVRDRALLDRNEAVYQDLTRESLQARGYTGPVVEPEDAARHLLSISAQHALTLFEYFQTDRAGHAADPAHAREVLALLDRFLGVLVDAVRREKGLWLVLTSDHGNIEDMTTNRHTLAPVPLAVLGAGVETWAGGLRSLTEVTPALVRALAA